MYGAVVKEVLKNLLMKAPAIRTIRAKHGRTTSTNTSEQATRIREQFKFYMESLGGIEDKVIFEIGPGDTIATGILLLKAGAARYVAFDRFGGDVFGEKARQLYRNLNCDIPELFTRVSLRSAIEEATPSSDLVADAIVSYNVVEHLYDPQRAFERMRALLKPGGAMVHRVDYSAHGVCQRDGGMAFLTLPTWLWTLMGSNRGLPSRIRHAEVMTMLEGLGFSSTDQTLQRFDSVDLERVRDRLPPRLRKMRDEDLLVAAARIVSRRLPELASM